MAAANLREVARIALGECLRAVTAEDIRRINGETPRLSAADIDALAHIVAEFYGAIDELGLA